MTEQPHDKNAELGVIGSVLLSPQATLAKQKINELTPSDFYDSRNKIVWRTILDMYTKGLDIDLINLSCILHGNNHLDQIGGDEYLLSCQEVAIVPNHSCSYADTVKDYSIRRQEISILNVAIDSSVRIGSSSDETITKLASINLQRTKDVDMNVLTEEWLDRCESGKVGHMNWWCEEWDRFLGLLSQELMIFHAPRSTGKTALMLQWIIKAHKKKHRVPLASIEMLKQELCGRFVAHIGQVNSYNMRIRGMVTQDEKSKAKKAIEELKVLELCIRDKSMTIQQICTWARSEVRKGVNCIFIDNLLSISDGGKQYQSKTIMYDHFIRELRNLRDSLSVPIVLLAHPNEETGRVAWSKDVENFADIILYMVNVPNEGVEINGEHIPCLYGEGGKHVLLKFQKNRQGISPTASAVFNMETQTFKHIKWENV